MSSVALPLTGFLALNNSAELDLEGPPRFPSDELDLEDFLRGQSCVELMVRSGFRLPIAAVLDESIEAISLSFEQGVFLQ
jgi:hypothetical protein